VTFGLFLGTCCVVVALAAPLLCPYDPALDSNLALRLKAPTMTAPFGTDSLGRNILLRVAHGARLSLGVGIGAVALAALVGSLVGLVAGYAGRSFDLVAMFCMDILLAFPPTLLAIAIVAMAGPGLTNALLAISLVSVPFYARLIRSVVLSVKEEEFVAAARGVGASHFRVLARHVLPASVPPVIVQASLGIAFAVLEVAALGFLGLGAQPPAPEWGTMLAESYKHFTSGAWWAFVFPGSAIALTVLGFNLLGDGLRDFLDPRLRKQ
jgi:peptide/nickel transport system permease protein